jgi:hypothetical protein
MEAGATDKPCEACDGTGRAAAPTPYTNAQDSQMVPCEVCDGTGRIPAEDSGLVRGDRVRLVRDEGEHQAGELGTVIGYYSPSDVVVVSFGNDYVDVPTGSLQPADVSSGGP